MSEEQLPKRRDEREVSPLVRATAATGLITAGLGFPNLWKTVQKNFPKGTINSLLSIKTKSDLNTADLTFVLGKEVIDQNTTPAGVAASVNEILNKKKTVFEEQRETDIEFQKKFDNIQKQRQELEQFKDEYNKVKYTSLQERREQLEKLLDDDTGEYTIQKEMRERIISQEGKKGKKRINSYISGSEIILKNMSLKELKIDSIKRLLKKAQNSKYSSLGVIIKSNPVLAGLLNHNISDLSSDTLYEVFESLKNGNDKINQEVNREFLNYVTKKNMGSSMPFSSSSVVTYENGLPVFTRQSTIGDFNFKQNPGVDIDYNQLNDLAKRNKIKPMKYMEFRRNMESIIDSNFPYLEDKHLYGSSKDKLKGYLKAAFKEIDAYDYHNKSITFNIDKQNKHIVMNVGDIKRGGKISSYRIPVVHEDGFTITTESGVQKILSRGYNINEHGKAVVVNPYERSLNQLTGQVRRIIQGSVTEAKDDEVRRVKKLMRNAFMGDLKTPSAVSNIFKSNVMRINSTFLSSKKRHSTRIRNMYNQHNLSSAAIKSGKDIILWDTEFISDKRGPQIQQRHPELITTYQISATKVSSTGQFLGTKTHWLKSKKMDSIIAAYDNWKRSGSNLSSFGLSGNELLDEFREHLQAIHKSADIDDIINEIKNKGVDINDACSDIFGDFGKNSAFGTYYGSEGDQQYLKAVAGKDYLEGKTTFDVYDIAGLSSMNDKGSASLISRNIQRMEQLHRNEFIKIERIIKGHKLNGSYKMKAMLNAYEKTTSGDWKNRRTALIKLFQEYAHDANVDSSMTVALHLSSQNYKPLIGTKYSPLDRVNRIIQQPTTLRSKIEYINHYNIAAQLYGDTDPNIDPRLTSIIPTTRSGAMISKGAIPGIGANSYNFFEVANSGMKQTSQLFHGLNINIPNAMGKLVSPFLLGMERLRNHFGKDAINDNIAKNAEPVMANVFYTPKDFGLFHGGVIAVEQNMLKRMNAEHTRGITTAKITPKAGKSSGYLIELLRKIEKVHNKDSNKLDFFKGDYINVSKIDEINQALTSYFKTHNDEVTEAFKNGLIESGSRSKYFDIEQNTMLLNRELSNEKGIRYNKEMKARVSYLNLAVNNKNELKVAYQLSDLVELSKGNVGMVKGVFEGVENLDFVIGERHLYQKNLKPFIATAGNLFHRGEIGTTKQLMVNRIFANMKETKGQEAAVNFLKSLFVNSTVTSDGRILDKFNNISTQIEAVNNITAEKLHKGMIDSGLVWTKKDIKLHARIFNIKEELINDHVKMANEFDRTLSELLNKTHDYNIQAKGGSWTEALNAMRDKEDIKLLRSAYNPFWNQLSDNGKGAIVDSTKVDTAMVWDHRERSDGTIIPGFTAPSHITTHQTFHYAGRSGMRPTNIKFGSYLLDQFYEQSPLYKSNITQNILNRHIGVYKHETRNAILGYFESMVGLSSVKDRAIKLNAGDSLKNIIARTLTHTRILKESSGSNIDIRKFNHPDYKNKMKEVLEQTQIEDIKLKIEALESKRKLSIDEENQLKFFKQQIKTAYKEVDFITQKYGTSKAVENITDMTDTLWAGIKNGGKLLVDGKDIGTADFLLLNNIQGVNNVGNREMWQNLLDNIQKETAENIMSPKQIRLNNMMTAVKDFIEQTTNDGLVLPGPKIIAEIENLNKMIMGNNYSFGTLPDSYASVIMAYNEAANAGSNAYLNGRFSEKLDEFNKQLVKPLLTKKIGKGFSVLYGKGQVVIEGGIGLVRSPFHAISSVQSLINKGAQGSESELGLAKKLMTGQYNFIEKSEFLKMKIKGQNIPSYLKGLGMDQKQINDIVTGKESIDLITGRYPLETNIHGIGSFETMVYDSKNPYFAGLSKKGFIPAVLAQELIKADNDGDLGVLGMLNFRSVSEFNEYAKLNRDIKSRHMNIAHYYTQRVLDTGSTTQAAKDTQLFFKTQAIDEVMTTAQELSYAMRMGDMSIEASRKIVKHSQATPGRTTAYTLESLSKDEQMKLGKMWLIDSDLGNLAKFSKNIVLREHIQEMYAKSKLQTTGQHAVGYVQNQTMRMTRQFQAVTDYIEQGLFNKVFPADYGKYTPEKIAQLKEHYGSIKNKAYEIALKLKDPSQSVISTKKAAAGSVDTIRGITSSILEFTENFHNIFDDKYANVRKSMGLDLTNDEVAAGREFKSLFNTIMKHDAIFASKFDNEEALTTSIGKFGFESMVLHNAQMRAVEAMTQKLGPEAFQTALEGVVNDNLTSNFSNKTATAWRNQVKQTLYHKTPKSLLAMGVGLGIATFFGGTGLTGGLTDFGIDLGNIPGTNTKSRLGKESLNPVEDNDIYSKKWTYLLKNDPALKDNINSNSTKSYYDLSINNNQYSMKPKKQNYKYNYIDHRKSYNKYYETEDMRRNKLAKF